MRREVRGLEVGVVSKSLVEVVFKVNGALQDVDDDGNIDDVAACLKDVVNVELCNSAELISYHRFHIPLSGEDLLILLFKLLQSPFEPGKPAFSVVKGGVRLTFIII